MPESLKPSRDIADEPASERLLKASAVMAIEPEMTPAAYLPANSSTFRKMPSTLHSVPYALRTAALPYSVRFFINIFDRRSTILPTPSFNRALALLLYIYCSGTVTKVPTKP